MILPSSKAAILAKYKAQLCGWLTLWMMLFLSACDNQNPNTEIATTEKKSETPIAREHTNPIQPLQEILSHKEIEVFKGDLDQMQQRKIIRALVTYSKTDFFILNGQIRGLQAELLQSYEKELNKGIKREANRTKVIYIPVAFDQLIPALDAGLGDIAAALLTDTQIRRQKVNFASGGANVRELIVRNKNAEPINSIDQLAGKTLYVLRSSSYAEHLAELNRKLAQQRLQPITVIETPSALLSEDILELVNAGVYHYTVIDDYKAKLWSKVLKDIHVEEGFSLSSGNHVGWAIRKQTPQLQASLEQFIAKRVKKGSLLGNILIKRYIESEKWISNPLLNTERDKLVRLYPLFDKYANNYSLETTALIAQAYQESKLDNNVTSHRGAVGIMQLLPSTAADKNVAVKDIRKLEPNIHAGAKYMSFLKNRYFDKAEISTIDKHLLALAAYNAGPGNVIKMRRLTAEMGLDPNRWFGNVELAAARLIGNETVRYVSNIYKYYTAYNLSLQLQEEKIQLLQQHVN